MAEVYVQSWKAYWLSTPYAQELNNLVARVIEDRKESPISNVVCLSIGGFRLPRETILSLRHIQYGPYAKLQDEATRIRNFVDEKFNRHRFLRDIQQFVVVEQIVGELAKANPNLLSNLVAQDIHMEPEWRTLFETHGFTVVENPAAFDLVGPNTLLISIGMDGAFFGADWKGNSGEVECFWETEMRHVEQRTNVSIPALLVRSFRSWETDLHLAAPRRVYPDPWGSDRVLVAVTPGTPHSRAVMRNMFDEKLYKHEDVPCHRPYGKDFLHPLPKDGNDTMHGLGGLDIWWRPVTKTRE
jgi:hypothetical protein